MSLYLLANARTDEQMLEMERLGEEGRCIFCPENLRIEDMIRGGEHWNVMRNRYPYPGTLRHLLLVPDEHVTRMTELSQQTQADFWTTIAWVEQEYDMRYYGLGARNGNPFLTGGTIAHLHFHVLVGDGSQPVRMKFSA